MRKDERHRMLLSAIKSVGDSILYESTPSNDECYNEFMDKYVTQVTGVVTFDSSTGGIILRTGQTSAVGFRLTNEQLSKYQSLKIVVSNDYSSQYALCSISGFGEGDFTYLVEVGEDKEVVLPIKNDQMNFISISNYQASTTVRIVSIKLE